MRGATKAAQLLGRFTRHAKARMGLYEKYRKIDWSQVDRLVFVCTGNICRSPYAEARARSLGLNAVSLGTRAVSGAPADESAMCGAELRGLNLHGFRSRAIHEIAPSSNDLVLLMQESHLKELPALWLAQAPQISLLGLWSSPPDPVVPDPFCRESAFFEAVFTAIDSSILYLADRPLPDSCRLGRNREAR